MQTTPKIYDFDCYKRYVAERIESMPGGGRGQYRKIASQLSIHTSLVSQVFRGTKHLTPEQGYALAENLGLDEEETDYLLLCIQRDRAGSRSLKRFYQCKVEVLRSKWELPSSRVRPRSELQESDKAEFYSHWYLSAVRLLTSIEGCQTVDAIAARLGLPAKLVADVARFLVASGLCEERDGRLKTIMLRTHTPADSPHVVRHHQNWRLKALEKIQFQKEPYISFTSPFTASLEDRAKLRRLTSEYLGEFSRVVDESPAEQLFCLNLDWFAV
ncbi:DUF4423 domain-containing protein [bacterium]|nr:DUF4423 domain-containing protein [bacterium]